MVTIEQKLTLFSKLLNQDIKEEASKKFQDLEKEYEKRMAENKFQTDKEANEIVEQTRKRAETKKVELISHGRLSSKKEMMSLREELINRFLTNLYAKVRVYTQTEGYLEYLNRVIQSLESLRGYENDLIIYLTQEDYNNHRAFIEQKLVNLGIASEHLTFDVSSANILGGLVVKDPALNMRIDESISTLIDEAKDEIVERISLAIGGVGDAANE